ncbi:MAG: polyprenyl synthetase family protein [Candidatus Lokiarchaeota archaeon]|nr:polyprenyl synthetase family protein [Candidatus Lokiarchaeota archaeon]
MSFKEILKEEVLKIEDTIASFFNQYYLRPGKFSNPFLFQFYSDIKKYILNGGKRLRPASLIMIYRGLGGSNASIYEGSICVELLHNASLVHDDIIDHDLVRRGEPSFHAHYDLWFQRNLAHISDQIDFGMAMGILGGDLLIDLGQESLIKSAFEPDRKFKALIYYQVAFKEIVNGVLAESYIQNIPIEHVSELDYFDMISKKTAALFEKSILIGAVLADPQESFKKELSNFALSLGQAFQIRDDILGIFGDAKKTGKSSDSDIREGKKTLLSIYANQETDISDLYGKRGINQKEIKEVRQIMVDSGALEKTRSKANQFCQKAKEMLSSIEITGNPLKFFNELIDYVQFRSV